MLRNRPFGHYAHTYWMMLTCNVFVPQLLWFRGPGGSGSSGSIAIVVNIGMWLERYVIVVTSLSRDFLPSSWSNLSRDGLGLRDLLWLHRPVLLPVVPLHPLPAGHLDRRDARAGARDSERTAHPAAEIGGTADDESIDGNRGDLRTHGRVREPGGSHRGDPGSLRPGLPDDGGLHAVPRRGIGRGPRLHSAIGSRRPSCSGAWSVGSRGYFMQWYSAVDRLSDQRGRPAAS